LSRKPFILILGAGPSGLGAAFRLTKQNLARVTVIEKCENVGGMAGSFELAGIQVDYGSHRLHPSCDFDILQDLRALLGNDLLQLPRHGRIRLCGRWVHFPLRPFDLAANLPPRFSLGVATDLIVKVVAKKSRIERNNFAMALERGLGKTVFSNFYAPYAKKIWGFPPEQLSVAQAERRVSANSFKKLIVKLISIVPAVITGRSKQYYYHPRNGFGQIGRCLFNAAEKAGAEFILGVRIKSLTMDGDRISSVKFGVQHLERELRPDYIWSTIPFSDLLSCLEPKAPPSILGASDKMRYRSLVLVYLVVAQKRFSDYDAHYFPEADFPITRLSEPKNYTRALEPSDRTVLCGEIPCFMEDPVWSMSGEDLAELVFRGLHAADIPLKNPVKEIFVRRIQKAYPVYELDYLDYFGRIDQWLRRKKNLLSFGRHGLYSHDNVHHAFSMAYAAVECLDGNGHLDRKKWDAFRQIFDSYVVED
jgi:protoporphyrinogen oxidase